MSTFLHTVLSPGAELQKVATGATWSEGPCWIPGENVLRWSDIHGNRILAYSPQAQETFEYQTQVEFTNGRTWHPDGYVVQCSHGQRRVETDKAGVVEPLIDHWGELRFNSPNDVVVASDGSVWFTDPHYGLTSPGEGHPGEMEYGACYVFRWDPQTSEVMPVITDVEEPNGLAFSPDESVLYVSDTSAVRKPAGVGNKHVRAYDVLYEINTEDRRNVSCTNSRTLFEIPAGIPDGFRVDTNGNIWCSSGNGVHVYDPDGEHLGHIPVPEVVGNLCFGGEDGTDLYICATTSIYRISTTVRGAEATMVA